MDYKDINDRWKKFLFENTFKEDKLIDPDKAKKKKKQKPEARDKEDGKQIITNEFEDFEESLEEMSGMSGGSVSFGVGNAFNTKKKKRKKNKYEFLEEEEGGEAIRKTPGKPEQETPEERVKRIYNQSQNPISLTTPGGPNIRAGVKGSIDNIGSADIGTNVRVNPKTGIPEVGGPSVVVQGAGPNLKNWSGRLNLPNQKNPKEEPSFDVTKASSEGSPWGVGVGRTPEGSWTGNVGYKGDGLGAGVKVKYNPKTKKYEEVGADVELGEKAGKYGQLAFGAEVNPNDYRANLKWTKDF